MAGMPLPVWVWGAEFVAPVINTQIIRIIPAVGRIGVVYGYHYVSQEASAAGKVGRLRLNINATAVIVLTFDIIANQNPFVSPQSLAALRGNGVDFIEIINAVAGVAATIHRAGILYQEIDFPVPVIESVHNPDYRRYPYA